MLLLAVARAAVLQPASLPALPFPRLTDRQADQGGTRSVHGEIQFREETNVLHRRKDVVVLGRRGGDPGKRTSEHGSAHLCLNVGSFIIH